MISNLKFTQASKTNRGGEKGPPTIHSRLVGLYHGRQSNSWADWRFPGLFLRRPANGRDLEVFFHWLIKGRVHQVWHERRGEHRHFTTAPSRSLIRILMLRMCRNTLHKTNDNVITSGYMCFLSIQKKAWFRFYEKSARIPQKQSCRTWSMRWSPSSRKWKCSTRKH